MNRALNNFSRGRRGTVYVVVLAMAMVVSTISFGAMVVARNSVRSSSGSADFAVARLNARAGLELAMWKIASTPTWRTTLGNGTWYNQVPLGQGTFTVSAADPITGDVTLNTNHPVVLTCTGAKGSAVYKTQTTVQVGTAAVPAVGYSVIANGNLSFSGNDSVSSDETMVSNKNIGIGSGDAISANLASVSKINVPGGVTLNGSTQLLSGPITMPDSTHVYDYYTANGTAIPYSSLYLSNATQLAGNTDFETNTTGWYVYSGSSATLARSAAQHKSGSYSLLTSGRSSVNDVPATDLPLNLIRSGDSYAVSIQVYGAAAIKGTTFAATLTLQTSTGTTSFSTPTAAIPNGGGWINPKGNLVPTWTGTLTKATLRMTTSNSSSNFYLDQVSLKDSSLTSSQYQMDRVVVSPNSNPYGTTNAQGVYVLDCNNQAVTIGPCRIVGTLLVKNFNSLTIQGPIEWEPAVVGYPALLTDKDVSISFDKTVGLSEATYGVNFNPTGTPYPYTGGSTNTTATDAYPSIINGLIYVGGKISFSTNPKMKGAIIATGDIAVGTTGGTFNFDNSAYVNPPPGFTSNVPTVTAMPGTWQRIVGP